MRKKDSTLTSASLPYSIADTPIRELRVLLTPGKRQHGPWQRSHETLFDCDAESVPWPECTVSAVLRGERSGAGIGARSPSASF